MVISFSGSSAAGKSSIIAQIKKSEVFQGRKVIVREEDSFITIKIIKHILGDNIFSKYKEEKYFKKNYQDFFYKLFSSLCYIFYPTVVYTELLIESIRYQLLFKNTILIADRNIYDYLVTFRNALEIHNKFVDWLYNGFPKPYLAFFIDIDIATVLQRNKNNVPGKITSDKSFHENTLAHYRQIAKKNNLLVIKNNNDLKETIEAVMTHIRAKKKLINAKRIAICGLDGTGKTTIANMLAGYANSLNIRSKVVHFYHENLLFKLLRFIGYYKFDEDKELVYERSMRHSARERVRKTPFILAFLRFFDSYIQYLFFSIIHRNKLIIIDRYLYDYLVSFEYLNIKPRGFFNKLIPSIKHKFLLTAMPSTANKRKPESVREFFLESHKIYLKVAKEHDIKIIDTENKRLKNILAQLLESIN